MCNFNGVIAESMRRQLIVLCAQTQDDGAAGPSDQADHEEPAAEAAEDAEYEYVADGAAREAGEAQALGPATEEQAAELRGADRPDVGERRRALTHTCHQ